MKKTEEASKRKHSILQYNILKAALYFTLNSGVYRNSMYLEELAKKYAKASGGWNIQALKKPEIERSEERAEEEEKRICSERKWHQKSRRKWKPYRRKRAKYLLAEKPSTAEENEISWKQLEKAWRNTINRSLAVCRLSLLLVREIEASKSFGQRESWNEMENAEERIRNEKCWLKLWQMQCLWLRNAILEEKKRNTFSCRKKPIHLEKRSYLYVSMKAKWWREKRGNVAYEEEMKHTMRRESESWRSL